MGIPSSIVISRHLTARWDVHVDVVLLLETCVVRLGVVGLRAHVKNHETTLSV